jgi:hypothetical protein
MIQKWQMENGGAAESQHSSKQQQYEGEDLSPTTARELRGFYAYGLAAEVFAVCGVGKYQTCGIGIDQALTSYRIFPTRNFGAARKGTWRSCTYSP